MSITATERTQIVELTTLMFNAAPGATYLSEIVDLYEASGHNLAALAESLSLTGAYNTVFPNTLTSSEFAVKFLSTVGLQSDQLALNFVISKLNAGVSRGQVVLAAFNALNNVTSTDAAQYQAAKAELLNKTAVAEFYSDPAPTGIQGAATDLVTLQNVVANVTSDPASIAPAEQALQNAVNANIVLKPTADTISSGVNVIGDLTPFFFNGIGPTLNSTDNISNVQTLTITDQFGTGVDIIPAGATLSNIPNVVLQSAGNAGGAGQPFDTSGISGLTNLTITTSGAAGDLVNAAATTDITMTQNNQADAAVVISGGRNVTVTASGAGGAIVGTQALGAVPPSAQLPAGTVTVTDKSAGAGGVNVLGGTAVTVNVTSLTNTGAINIGNTAANTGNSTNGGGTNATGAINVSSVATAGGAMTIFGGTSVNVSAAGNTITVGDVAAKVTSNEATGAITVADQQATTFDNLKGAGHTTVAGGLVSVYGGTNVNVTTNTGSGVTIGADGLAKTLPTGTITVVDSASNLNGPFNGLNAGHWADRVIGGTDVNVTAAGAFVLVGDQAAAPASTKAIDNPTGQVTVTETVASHAAVAIDGGNGVTVNAQGQRVILGAQAGVGGAVVVNQASPFTGNSWGSSNAASRVVVDGGTTVTVNTTGGNVFVGNNSVANLTRQVPSGAVTINDTFSGANTANGDTFGVLGGTTVSINVANGTSSAINVGAAGVLDSTGTQLTNGALDASGNVTIVNGSAATAFGTGATNVTTNGSATVSVTGGGAATITDVQTTAATGGANVGKAIGTSTLATVNLTNVNGAAAITSDALTALSVTNSLAGALTTTTVTDAKAHSLAVTLNNTAKGTSISDGTATAVTISTAGSAKDSIALTAGKATALTFSNGAALTVTAATLSGTGPDLIVANGAGALNLGNTTAWGGAAKISSIDASAATGNVTATISGDNTSFKGGAGNDVVTVNESFQLAKVIDGGAGTNTVVLTNVASIYNPLLNPTGPISADFTNFQNLGLAAGTNGTYDVSGFANVIVSGSAGPLTLVNAASAETLTFTGTPGGATNWQSGASASIVIDGSAGDVNAGFVQTGNATTGAKTVNISSIGDGNVAVANLINLSDAKAATTALNISGDANVTVTDGDSTVKTITVTNSAAVDVTAVVAASAGLTATGGAGKLTVNMNNHAANSDANVDVVTSGSGGVVITHIGAGNSTVAGTGSETINLGASAAVRDTMTADDTPGTAGEGTRAVINGFGLGTNANLASGDVITFSTPKTVVANTASVAGASGSTYSVSNGIVTILTKAVGLTGLTELADVQGIVDATANTVGAVTIAGTTYVIASDATTGTPAADTVLQLSGVTGVTGFGLSKASGVSMGAGSTIMSTDVGLINAGHTGSAVANTTFADLGFGADSLTASAAGITNTYQNLGNWAELDVGGAGVAAGNAVVTQVGTAPKELYLKATGSFTLDSLTVDGALVLDTNGNNATIKSLTNATNTATTMWVTGAGTADIKGLFDTALTKFDASKATGLVTVGDGAAVSNAGVTFKGGIGGLNVTASGAGDTIIGADSGAGDTVLANGNGDTINLSSGLNTITANGTGDTITVGTLNVGAVIGNTQTIHASGAGDTITFASVGADGGLITWTSNSTVDGGTAAPGFTVGIGNNSTVNYGNNVFGVGTENVVVTGDLAGTDSSGAVSMITLGNVAHNAGDLVTFNNVATDGTTHLNEIWGGQVNVAGATTLAQALDLAASIAALSQQAGGANTPSGVIGANTGVVDWFQFGGNTYIVEAINGTASGATHTALAAGDQVIKIVGLVDLSGDGFVGHTVQL